MSSDKLFIRAQVLWSIQLPLTQADPFGGAHPGLGCPCGGIRNLLFLPQVRRVADAAATSKAPEGPLRDAGHLFPQSWKEPDKSHPAVLHPCFLGVTMDHPPHLHMQVGTTRLKEDTIAISLDFDLGSITKTASHSNSSCVPPQLLRWRVHSLA